MSSAVNRKTTIAEAGGEFAFLSRVLARAPSHPDSVIVGPGDDAAVLKITSPVAVTTDMLVERRHFRLDWIEPYDAGWRAAIASISDLAAMGSHPRYGFLSLGLPPGCRLDQAEEIVRGVTTALEAYGASLAGGDTVATEGGVVLNVCLLGEWAGRSCLRSSARPGDQICVTGRTGGSRAAIGLLARLGREAVLKDYYGLFKCHQTPYARLDAGLWLSQNPSVHALMDVSDGLSSDLWRIAEASGVRCVVDPGLVPCHPEAVSAAHLTGEDAASAALHGGEDFELVYTVEAERAREVAADLQVNAGTSASVIGEVCDGEPGVFDRKGSAIRPAFEHFVL